MTVLKEGHRWELLIDVTGAWKWHSHTQAARMADNLGGVEWRMGRIIDSVTNGEWNDDVHMELRRMEEK